MKSKLKILLAGFLVSLVLPTQGATFWINNVITGDGQGDVLFANNGALMVGGVVTMGYFPAGFNLSGGFGQIPNFIENYTVVASATVGSESPSLEGAYPGYVEAPEVSIPTIQFGDPLVGRAVYVFVGDGPTLASSGKFALKQVGTLAVDVPFQLTYITDLWGTPLIGANGSYTGDFFGMGASTFTTLELVPEPSASLLTIAGLGFFLRRRR